MVNGRSPFQRSHDAKDVLRIRHVVTTCRFLNIGRFLVIGITSWRRGLYHIVRAPMFLLASMRRVTRIERTFTLRITPFRRFRFKRRNMNRFRRITILFSICSARDVRIKIFTRMLRFHLLMIHISHGNRNAGFNANVRGYRPIKRVTNPSTRIDVFFRTSNRRAFNRIIRALIGLFPHGARITIKVCGMFFIQDRFHPVLRPITWYFFEGLWRIIRSLYRACAKI